jgi:Insecticide toxin TcdB middle/N-terminal region
MSTGKPHLLTTINNNMGKQVTITYAPSTEYYLKDRQAGTPWITKLPFPVHVIKEVEMKDLIGGTVHHTQYRYHHGFFDGPEREFRGFDGSQKQKGKMKCLKP